MPLLRIAPLFGDLADSAVFTALAPDSALAICVAPGDAVAAAKAL